MAFNILTDGIPVGKSLPKSTIHWNLEVNKLTLSPVYQGQEQHMKGEFSPYNRKPLWKTRYDTHSPLYNTTATLNNLRNHAILLDKHYVSNHSQELYLDGSTYATRKGAEGSQIVSVFSNQGSQGSPYRLIIPGAFAPGTETMEVLSCRNVTADKVGKITVEMDAGEPKVFYPVKKLDGSGLCGFKKRKTLLCTDGGGTGNITVKNHTKSEGTYELSSLGSEPSISSAMALLSVFAGVVSWLL
jgi:alpha-amylase